MALEVPVAYSIRARALAPSLPNQVVTFSLHRAFGSSPCLWGLIEQESPGGSTLLLPDEQGEKGAGNASVLINGEPPFVIPLIGAITVLINHLCHWVCK